MRGLSYITELNSVNRTQYNRVHTPILQERQTLRARFTYSDWFTLAEYVDWVSVKDISRADSIILWVNDKHGYKMHRTRWTKVEFYWNLVISTFKFTLQNFELEGCNQLLPCPFGFEREEMVLAAPSPILERSAKQCMWRDAQPSLVDIVCYHDWKRDVQVWSVMPEAIGRGEGGSLSV